VIVSLLLAVCLLAGNAFFVGAQFALITARRDQIEPLALGGSRRAQITLEQIRQLSTVLAGSQLGIALCSLGLGAVAEPAIARLLEPGFQAVGVPGAAVDPAALVVALAGVSYCHMVLGEMVPKNLGLAGPVRAALALGPPMAVWVRLTRPLVRAVSAAAGGVLRLLRIEPTDQLSTAYTPAELMDMIAESAAEGLLDPDEQQRLSRALALEQGTARDLAIPLDRLVTLSVGASPAQLEALVARTGYSRFPLRHTGPTGRPDIVGYLHAKDLLKLDLGRWDASIPAGLWRPMASIQADLPLSQVLTTLQHAGSHLGRVVEGEKTLGAITLEDVLEEFVGEVHDASHLDDQPGPGQPPST
jgi:CBS domain containing-hemolysin-like protein